MAGLKPRPSESLPEPSGADGNCPVYLRPMRPLLQMCAVLFFACMCHAQTYPLGPDSQVKDVPHGTVEKAVLPPGQFFPGTPHGYAVYTPANAGTRPLPYVVFLDGSSYLGDGLRAPVVLDNLIAAKAIPPMIGIFVDPGVLPAIRPDAQNRYERVFEYDSLSNRYSQFLLTELLPAVAKKHALSTDPNEHAIAGTSTGAVGAFVAAWHRPDQFRRVLSLIGTYVAMKGADTLPEIVRKTEAKPLRIWMQDGANDHITPTEPYGTFFAGTWPQANRLLFDALQFEGYDAKLTIGTGGHDTKQGSAELPEALRWLWRDYAETGKVQPIVPHAPAALGDAGWMTRGSVWATVDTVGEWEDRGSATNPNLDEVTQIALGGIAQTRSGVIYAVGGGTVIWGARGAKGSAIVSPTPSLIAVALSPDQAMLVVVDMIHRHQWSMQLQADGTPTNAEPFYRLEVLDDDGGATGAAFDSLGQVYFATALGVQVCEANGRVAMILNSPVPDKPVTSVAFGGPDRDWLYVIADGKLFRRKMKVHGVATNKPEKPPQPPL
jgi:gluconolactonase